MRNTYTPINLSDRHSYPRLENRVAQLEEENELLRAAWKFAKNK